VWAKDRSSSEGAEQDLREWAVFTVDSGRSVISLAVIHKRAKRPRRHTAERSELVNNCAAGKAVRAGLAVEGAYLNGYVTDEQRSRRPIFIATLWAVAGWLFFRVARSLRPTPVLFLSRETRLPGKWCGTRVARALKNSQLTCGETYAYFGDRTPVCIDY